MGSAAVRVMTPMNAQDNSRHLQRHHFLGRSDGGELVLIRNAREQPDERWVRSVVLR